LEEIISTEKQYVVDLDTIIKVFLQAIRKSKIIEEKDIEALFSNIEEIFSTNSELLHLLIQRLSDPSRIVVGDIFTLQAQNLMKAYKPFVSNHQKAFDLFQQLIKENPDFNAAIRKMENNFRCNGLDFMGFLIKPVQRICKYPLLIKELLKETEPSDQDFENLTRASSDIQQVIHSINEFKRSNEILHSLLLIQSKVVGTKNFEIVTKDRQFVCEGTFSKISKGKSQVRHFFLLSDVLLYTKMDSKNNNLYHYAGHVMLNKALIRDIPDSKTFKLGVEITRIDKKRKPYIICFSSIQEKSNWFDKLVNCISISIRAEP